MSLPSAVTLLKTAITNYTNTLVELFQKTPAASVTSDNASTLGGKTIEEIIGDSVGGMADHIVDMNNPHNLTLEQINSYDSEYIDSTIGQKVPIGLLPISRYGTMDYLPPGISGSYNSGTVMTGGDYQHQALCYEDDGTLVFIYSGTDGATQGAYYGYISNATGPVSAQRVVHTNKPYRPAFIPAGYAVKHICRGNNDAIVGVAHRVSDGGDLRLFVVATNGTYDEAQHQGALLPTSLFNPLLAQYDYYSSMEPVVNGSYMYLIWTTATAMYNVPDTVPVEVFISRIPLAQIKAGNVTTLAPMTTWATTGVHTNGTFTNIRLVGASMSRTQGSDALFYYPATAYAAGSLNHTAGLVSTTAVDKATGKMRLFLFSSFRIYPVPSIAYTLPIVVSMVVDPDAKTAVVDTEFRGGCNVTYPTDYSSYTFSNANYVTNDGMWVMYGGTSRIVTGDGYMLSLSIPNYQGGFQQFYRAKIEGYTDMYSSWKPGSGTFTDTVHRNLIPGGPTPIMNGIYAVNILPDGYATCISYGKGSNHVRVQYKTAAETPTSVYKSLTWGTLKGYSPKTDRKLFSEFSYTFDRQDPGVFEMRSSGLVGCSGANLSSWRLSGPTVINADLSSSGGVSVTQEALDATTGAVIGLAGLGVTANGAKHQLIIPVLNSTAPVLMLSSIVDNNRVQREFLSRVTVNTRSGTITSITVNDSIMNWSGIAVNWDHLYENDWRCHYQSAVVETAEGWMYAITNSTSHRVVGNTFTSTWKVFINKTTLAAEGAARNSWPPYYTYPFMYVPGVGFGILYTFHDVSTKAVFAPYATTKAQFLAWTAPTSDNYVTLFSQKNAEGWVVYFTEETPVLVSGRPFDMESTSIDLRNVVADPKNKTFYVYVRLVGGLAEYQISTTTLPETDTTMFIGTVTTSDTEIIAINVDKVTRLGIYRPSAEPIGAGIAVSSGNPAQTGTIDTEW